MADLVDVATVSVLRTRWLRSTLTDRRFSLAVAHVEEPPAERVPTLPLVRRAFELRAVVTADDDCPAALAGLLDSGLVTQPGWRPRPVPVLHPPRPRLLTTLTLRQCALSVRR